MNRSRRALVLLSLLVSFCAPAASASEPVAPDTAAYRAEPDSSANRRITARGLSRLIAEADSTVKAHGGSHADDAQLFLSWNAPWGSHRAQRTRQPACGDSVLGDTLYLCLRTGRAAERFTGFTGTLAVHAVAGDTLGSWWQMKSKGGANPGSIRVEWASANAWPEIAQPFRVAGQGFASLENIPTAARIRLIFAVPFGDAGPVAGDSLYTLARVVIRHHPERRLAGCDRPVVIEWETATLAFGPKDEPEVSRGERLVSFAGPYSITEAFHGARTRAWKPPQAPAPAAKPPGSSR